MLVELLECIVLSPVCLSTGGGGRHVTITHGALYLTVQWPMFKCVHLRIPPWCWHQVTMVGKQAARIPLECFLVNWSVDFLSFLRLNKHTSRPLSYALWTEVEQNVHRQSCPGRHCYLVDCCGGNFSVCSSKGQNERFVWCFRIDKNVLWFCLFPVVIPSSFSHWYDTIPAKNLFVYL